MICILILLVIYSGATIVNTRENEIPSSWNIRELNSHYAAIESFYNHEVIWIGQVSKINLQVKDAGKVNDLNPRIVTIRTDNAKKWVVTEKTNNSDEKMLEESTKLNETIEQRLIEIEEKIKEGLERIENEVNPPSKRKRFLCWLNVFKSCSRKKQKQEISEIIPAEPPFTPPPSPEVVVHIHLPLENHSNTTTPSAKSPTLKPVPIKTTSSITLIADIQPSKGENKNSNSRADRKEEPKHSVDEKSKKTLPRPDSPVRKVYFAEETKPQIPVGWPLASKDSARISSAIQDNKNPKRKSSQLSGPVRIVHFAEENTRSVPISTTYQTSIPQHSPTKLSSYSSKYTSPTLLPVSSIFKRSPMKLNGELRIVRSADENIRPTLVSNEKSVTPYKNTSSPPPQKSSVELTEGRRIVQIVDKNNQSRLSTQELHTSLNSSLFTVKTDPSASTLPSEIVENTQLSKSKDEKSNLKINREHHGAQAQYQTPQLQKTSIKSNEGQRIVRTVDEKNQSRPLVQKSYPFGSSLLDLLPSGTNRLTSTSSLETVENIRSSKPKKEKSDSMIIEQQPTWRLKKPWETHFADENKPPMSVPSENTSKRSDKEIPERIQHPSSQPKKLPTRLNEGPRIVHIIDENDQTKNEISNSKNDEGEVLKNSTSTGVKPGCKQTSIQPKRQWKVYLAEENEPSVSISSSHKHNVGVHHN